MSFAPGLVGTFRDSEGGDGRHCPSPSITGCRLGRLERRRLSPFETRRRIGQALALRPEKQAISAGQIINSESDPVVVAEIEFRSVAMQVLFADVEVAAEDAALEDRKEVILDGVGVPEHGAHILFGAVVDSAVPAKLAP